MKITWTPRMAEAERHMVEWLKAHRKEISHAELGRKLGVNTERARQIRLRVQKYKNPSFGT